MIRNPVISRGGTHCICFSGGDGVLSCGLLLLRDHSGGDVDDEVGPLHEKAILARHECGGVVSRRVDEGDFLGSPLVPLQGCSDAVAPKTGGKTLLREVTSKEGFPSSSRLRRGLPFAVIMYR